LNNNNSSRVNLNNVNRPLAAPVAAAGAAVPAADGAVENAAERTENEAAAAESNSGDETEPLAASGGDEVQEALTAQPHVSSLAIVRTFVLSFLSSIIPDAPAL